VEEVVNLVGCPGLGATPTADVTKRLVPSLERSVDVPGLVVVCTQQLLHLDAEFRSTLRGAGQVHQMVQWYHDTTTKDLTIRLPDEAAADAEALARVEGKSVNEMVKQSLIEAVERRRNDPQFKASLTKIIEEDRELLERLAK
jgi:hypothetical protein